MRESARHRRNGKDRLVLAADSHALNSFQSCNQQYYLSQADKLVSIKRKRAYDVGSMIHEIMHRITRAKLNRRPFSDVALLEIGYRVIKRAYPSVLKDKEEIIFHTARFTEFYVWYKNQEQFYKPLGTEVGFSKVLYEDMDVIFVYEGRIDLILRVEPADFVTWADYKSQSREYALYANRNQFLGYTWALGATMGFIIYYGLQKEKKDIFKFQPLSYHPGLIAQWKQETIDSFRRIISLVPFGADGFKRNRAACDAGKFGPCQYGVLCDNSWAGPEIQSALRRTFFKESDWTPWK